MRNEFTKQLEELNQEMTQLGGQCESAIALASQALLHGDRKSAAQVQTLNEEIEGGVKTIQALCLKILLQQQPVAGDLRTVSAALKMIYDMGRIGKQSADIAEIIQAAEGKKLLLENEIRDMALAVIKMVSQAVTAFVDRDAELAHGVIADDDIVDDQFVSIKKALAEQFANQEPEEILDLLMIAKYFERIGDHGVNIAQWVLFSLGE